MTLGWSAWMWYGKYATDEKMYYCPANIPSNKSWDPQSRSQIYSYTYGAYKLLDSSLANDWIQNVKGAYTKSSANDDSWWNTSRLPNPGDATLLADSWHKSGSEDGQTCWICEVGSYTYRGLFATHGGKANIVFQDGHAENVHVGRFRSLGYTWYGTQDGLDLTAP